MDQKASPAYQGLMGAFGQKKKKPDLQPGAPPPPAVNPYANFASYSQNQPPAQGMQPAAAQPPAQPAGSQQESALKKFRQKYGL